MYKRPDYSKSVRDNSSAKALKKEQAMVLETSSKKKRGHETEGQPEPAEMEAGIP